MKSITFTLFMIACLAFKMVHGQEMAKETPFENSKWPSAIQVGHSWSTSTNLIQITAPTPIFQNNKTLSLDIGMSYVSDKELWRENHASIQLGKFYAENNFKRLGIVTQLNKKIYSIRTTQFLTSVQMGLLHGKWRSESPQSHGGGTYFHRNRSHNSFILDFNFLLGIHQSLTPRMGIYLHYGRGYNTSYLAEIQDLPFDFFLEPVWGFGFRYRL